MLLTVCRAAPSSALRTLAGAEPLVSTRPSDPRGEKGNRDVATSLFGEGGGSRMRGPHGTPPTMCPNLPLRRHQAEEGALRIGGLDDPAAAGDFHRAVDDLTAA
ncbi:hypothetical protein ELH21_04795 [Rhizobium leguminosarum]|nr:hypothetical protein [Rhizobium leguminosarum bv. viciae]TBD03753.1 hypothetical protein ELH21_04795 [Rhizobium leguminosarum]